MSTTETIRTRFAPSPTGALHIGGLRTALFAWLFARAGKGKFILRIEDTDRTRLVPRSIEQIFAALQWVGLDIDEGPEIGGPHGPYVQSERLALYQQHAEDLVLRGYAYPCFCTPERLAQLREEQQAVKAPPRYDGRCRSLSADEAAERRTKEPYVLRLKLPEQGTVAVDDLIRGRVTFAYDMLDDSVLLKSDGYPTYHLAVVVDDHLMEITHVLRGEEWLPSTPKHLFLYEAFGWGKPAFAHLPIILSPGGGKLSKRDGALSVFDYRDQGYLPEALVNFLVLLGWNPKNDREEFTLKELIEMFTLEGVQKSGAIFDHRKLDHLNGRYLRTLSPSEILDRAGDRAQALVERFGERATDAVALLQDRLVTLNDLGAHGAFLVELPAYDAKLLIPKKGSAGQTQTILTTLEEYCATLTDTDFVEARLHDHLVGFLKKNNWSNAEALWPLRVALSGQQNSPGVFAIAALLGKKESLARMKHGMHLLSLLA